MLLLGDARIFLNSECVILYSFGKAFAGNGYQMPEEDLKEQIVETGDDKLFYSLNFH